MTANEVATKPRVTPAQAPAPVTLSPTTTGPKFDRHMMLQMYKTKVCRNWVACGLCDYGDRCQFAHGHEDLRERKALPNPNLQSRVAGYRLYRPSYPPRPAPQFRYDGPYSSVRDNGVPGGGYRSAGVGRGDPGMPPYDEEAYGPQTITVVVDPQVPYESRPYSSQLSANAKEWKGDEATQMASTGAVPGPDAPVGASEQTPLEIRQHSPYNPSYTVS